jgi:HK97 gp10 family phage protein
MVAAVFYVYGLSAMFSVSVEGLDREMQRLSDLLPPATQRAALLDGAKVLRQEVIAASPRRTGALSRSIYARAGSAGAAPAAFVAAAIPGKGRRMTNNAYYARFLEYGTKKMRAHPFMAVSLELRRSEVLSAIKNRLERAVMEKS